MATTQKTSSTTSSESLGRFALRCAIFFAPLVAGLVLTLVVVRPTGELYTPDQVAALQEQKPLIYLPDFHNFPLFFPRFHFAAARLRQPEVLVLGSSRSKTIRSEFFRNPKSMFNAGIPGHAYLVGDGTRFLQALPQDHLPKYVFVDIDPWCFRSAGPVDSGADFMRAYSTMEIIDFSWRKAFWWSLHQLRSPTPRTPGFIGIQAQREQAGLRPDGTLYTPRRQPDETTAQIEQHVELGLEPFFHDVPTPSAAALRAFDEFLTYCQAHGIRVIGFISSFRPTNYEVLKRSPQLQYYFSVGAALQPMFERTHSELFDFADPASLGCTDAEFLDLMHESDVCTVRMLIQMAKQSPTVASLVDVSALDAMLVHRKSSFELGF